MTGTGRITSLNESRKYELAWDNLLGNNNRMNKLIVVDYTMTQKRLWRWIF